MQRTVKEVMTAQYRACDEADHLGTAALRMWEADCGILPILSGRKLVGVVTDRDLCMGLALKNCRPDERTVREVASGVLYSCTPGATLSAALATMAAHRVRRLPVLDDGQLVGMLSLNDIVLAAGEPGAPAAQQVLDALRNICAHRRLPVAA